MAGSFGSPYRAPCGGWPAKPKIYFGGCQNHVREDEKNIVRWRNVTKVKDYADPPKEAGIDPYPKWNNADIPSCATSPVTEGACCPDDYETCQALGKPTCGPWAGHTDEILACAEEDESHVTVARNCYERTEELLDVALCRKVGYKLIQSMKVWHGMYGFNSHEYRATSAWCFPAIDYCNVSCPSVAEQPAPDDTKYRTLHITSTYTSQFGTGIAEREWTVARNSGALTRGVCDDTVPDPDNGELDLALDELGKGAFTLIEVAGFFCQRLTELIDGLGPVFSLTGSGGAWTATHTDGDSSWSLEVDMAAGHYEYHTVVGGNPQLDETLDVTATTCDYTRTVAGGETVTVSGELSDPYTTADLYDDGQELIALWQAVWEDDVVYPFRTDAFCTQGPLVTRDESPQPVSPFSGITNCLFCDEECDYLSQFTGEIIGAPNPRGYDAHFDFNHKIWDACTDEEMNVHWYVKFYGQASGQNGIPKSATQWTDNGTARFLRPGKWVAYGLGVSDNAENAFAGQLWMQDWMQSKTWWPSHNYFRPCGADRYAFQEDTVRCVESFDGTTVTLAPAQPESDAAVDDQVLITAAPAGIYQIVTVVDGRTFEVTLAAPSTGQPWTEELFGKLRWPLAWPICGRIAVTGATNASPIVLELAEPAPYLRNGDQITISDVTGNTVANGTKTVTRVDDTHFTLLETSGNGDYAGGGYVKSKDAPDYQWHDTQPKGDYVIKTWTFDYRDWQERDRVIAQGEACGDCDASQPADDTPIREDQSNRNIVSVDCADACVTFSACAPSVIVPGDFPETFAADDLYGARWHSIVQDGTTDPLWAAPLHRLDCAYVVGTGFDDETRSEAPDESGDMCPPDADGVVWYPHHPNVEARCAKPTGAPDLPADALPLGCATPDDCPPPGEGLDACLEALEFLSWLNQEICVCDGGRFAADYEAQGILCPQDPDDIEEIPPP